MEYLRIVRKFVALLLLATTVLAGCSNIPSAETTLTTWTRDAGLADVVQGVAASVTSTAADIKDLGSTPTDVLKMVTALKASGAALGTQAAALASQPPCSDAEYEKQRSGLVEAMRAYANTTANLQGLDLTGITESIKALTGISTSLAAFNTYVQEHGDDSVTAA